MPFFPNFQSIFLVFFLHLIFKFISGTYKLFLRSSVSDLVDLLRQEVEYQIYALPSDLPFANPFSLQVYSNSKSTKRVIGIGSNLF